MSLFLYENIVTLPDNIFYDKNSIITSPGFAERKNIYTIDKEAYAYSLDAYLKLYKKKIIYFSDTPETFDPVILDFITKIVSLLQDQYQLPIENIRYICGGSPIRENLELYKQHCVNNDLIQLPVTLINEFEFLMAKTLRANMWIREKRQLIEQKPKIFSCLNGVGRVTRIYLFLYFLNHNLLDKSFFSLHENRSRIDSSVRNSFIELNRHYTTSNSVISNYPKEFYNDLNNLFENFLNSDISLPIIQTIGPKDRKAQHSISQEDIELFDNCYFSVITETSFFKRMHLYEHGHLLNHYNSHLDSIFLTEKTFRAIACRHPFIMVSRPHTLKYLRDAGYKTFSPWIDESYDDIEDDFIRLQKIAEIIRDLCQKNSAFWLQFVNETQDIVSHNFNVLLNKQLCQLSG